MGRPCFCWNMDLCAVLIKNREFVWMPVKGSNKTTYFLGDMLVFGSVISNTEILQGSLCYQPKQCTMIREIPQNYHTFAACSIPPKMSCI